MRDIFHDLFVGQPTDPIEAARRAMRQPLRRRFYAMASVAEGEGDFAVVLDDRPVQTPVRHRLSAPTRPLAEAIAAEWEVQSELIDPARMPLTRLANSIIDGVATAPHVVT